MSTYPAPTALHPPRRERPTRLTRRRLRTTAVTGSLAALAVLVAACGSSSSGSTTTTTTGSSGTASLRLAATALPSVGKVLTGPDGRTLYEYTSDTAAGTACTGQCAVVWPPLTVPAGTTPVLPSGAAGTVSTASRPDGSTQVTYMGHRLYYYEGDAAPGTDKGQGVDGTWFVLTTSGTATGGTTTTTAAGGGGGGVGF